MILVVAISGRSLATAARRAGYRVLVADLFNDTDTCRMAQRATILPGSLHDGIDGREILPSLRRLVGEDRPEALVYGSGFERRPEIVDMLAETFPLAGNSAGAIRRVKDPLSLASLCAEIGIPHPEVRFDAPDDRRGWLTKVPGGAGGSHVRPATSFGSSPSGSYFQRHVPGVGISALFLAGRGRARVVGYSRQWSSPTATSPFRYGGAVRLPRLPREKGEKISHWLNGLVARTGLIGLCSADFIDGPEGTFLLEINPRPGATLDIFDGEDTPLLTQHLRAVRGENIDIPRFTGVMASAVAYAAGPIPSFPDLDWPPLTADHQRPGSELDAGDPVCTVLAQARSAAAAEKAVMKRISELAPHWEEITG
ncbi:ATP-grasp domain-containing protein [Ciceribacter azotifigens]|uniref:ATP-grasp domain-containing protein n=1 Tax=Ciceribacter azotifigens TaxID=2069303 RepID=UPI003A856120